MDPNSSEGKLDFIQGIMIYYADEHLNRMQITCVCSPVSMPVEKNNERGVPAVGYELAG